MQEAKPFSLLALRWRKVEPPLKYPQTEGFGAMGFRGVDGPEGIFSIYVVLLDGPPSPEREQRARVYALVDQMEGRLPGLGERFVITAGSTPVAEGVVIDTGRG